MIVNIAITENDDSYPIVLSEDMLYTLITNKRSEGFLFLFEFELKITGLW